VGRSGLGLGPGLALGLQLGIRIGFTCNHSWSRLHLRLGVTIASAYFEFVNNQQVIIITAQCICAVLGSHVVCLSVRLSVTLVDCDHIGRKYWKLIARTISPTPSLFAAKRRST